MTDLEPTPAWRRLLQWRGGTPLARNEYTEAALARHKREGLALAVKARWITMAVIAVLLVFINPQWNVLYYHAVLAVLALNGWLMQRFGQVGRSRPELALIFADLAVMTVGMVMPNPFSDSEMPLAMQYRFDNFLYFFVILAAGTLAFSWRTVIAIGAWTVAMWAAALIVALGVAQPVAGLSDAAAGAFAGYPELIRRLDPNAFQVSLRIQEMVVFLIVAVTLGFSARRFNHLLISNAGLERERANLSRYFSPNVVEELSQNDEPLKKSRSHDIAVLFVDIVGFTRFSADRTPEQVIEVLRDFHARMERAVFRHNGTLDKYLGDGLMATFGTPSPGPKDATNALDCGRAMLDELNGWNRDRRRAGEPEIHAGVGIHYGPAVLGNIGANRLEFAVIGTTVNIANRLEALTRTHDVRMIVSDALRRQVAAESGKAAGRLAGFRPLSDVEIRGIDRPMSVCALT